MSTQTFRSTFKELRMSGGFGTLVCSLTLEGSFHARTFAKVAGKLIGYITSSTTGTCTSGSATVLRETLPWHLRYNGFAGTLPNIALVITDVIGFAYQIREPIFGITCLARSTVEVPARVTYTREGVGALTTATMGGEAPTNCGSTLSFSGTSNTLTVLSSSSRITLTLI